VLCKLATSVLDHKVTSGDKQVLVQLGSYNRVVTLDCDSLHVGATEREAILASIRIAWSVNYFEDCVPDKTVFRINLMLVLLFTMLEMCGI